MMIVTTLLSLTGCSALADLPLGSASGSNEPEVAGLVASLMKTYHYDGRRVDDAMAEVWLDNYLSSLDFSRSIFLQSDIDGFRALARTMDDDIHSRDPQLDVARKVYDVYRTRVAERVADANAILDAGVDLTDDEDYHYDRSEAEWPADAAAAKEIWRQRVEEQFILGNQAKRSDEDTTEMLRKRYHRLQADVESADSLDILERYLSALTTVYDPHSVYFKPASQDNFDIEMQNSLEGIGASLRTQGPYTVVMELIAGGPAEKGGELQPGDKIIAVGQGDDAPEDVIDLRIDKVVKQIRGKKGTEVKLTVIPSDATDPSQTRVISIVRDKVVLADSDAELHIHEVDGKRFARIDIPSFYYDPRSRRSASSDLEQLLGEMTKDGPIDGVILDLRENGGGSLQEAVRMTGLFIKRGPVVQIREQDGSLETLKDKDPRVAWDGPLMVLTSPLSASASEIVAGAIQDYGRGIVVGSEKTHGKGTVQTLINLDEMMSRLLRSSTRAGALKLTTQKFYRINGESTQVRGVEADVVIPSPWDGLEIYESDQDHALPWDTIAPTQYEPMGDLGATIERLQATSGKRVASSDGFRELAEELAERDELRETKVVSLNLEKRLAEASATKKPGDAPEDEPEDDKPHDDEDLVLDEALAVMLDYLGT